MDFWEKLQMILLGVLLAILFSGCSSGEQSSETLTLIGDSADSIIEVKKVESSLTDDMNDGEENLKTDEADLLMRLIISYLDDYEIHHIEESGKVEIRIMAPDFCQIEERILQKGEAFSYDSFLLEIQQSQGREKEYVFLSDSEEIDDIQNAFLYEVIREDLTKALAASEYSEQWVME